MTVTVYGAGAIGGITGAALARAGHDVLLVDINTEHVDAMNAHGLTIERAEGAVTVPVRAVTPDALGGGFELVLLAVKSHHTAQALRTLAPRLAPGGAIVSIQNGLSEELIAAEVGAARTIGCLVNWAGDWLAPGRIQHGGEGAFVLGELDGRDTPRVRELAGLLAPVAETRVSTNIWGYKWAKHVYGALLFATALVDAHIYDVVERSPEIQHALTCLVAEGIFVADAWDVTVEPFDEFDPVWYRAAAKGDAGARGLAMEAVASHYRKHTKTKSGIWRDLAVRKRKTEVDGQTAVTAAKARARGVPVPLTTRLITLIQELETGHRQMAWANLDELVKVAPPLTRKETSR
jgi:2-dehydropantoate 2-reductase